MENRAFDKCIARIRRGDKNALKEIYEAYAGYIYMIIHTIVGNKEDAEDLTCEFFLRLWKKADTYKKGSGHKVWISAIAKNLAVDFMRNQKETNPLNDLYDGLAAPEEKEPEQMVVGAVYLEELLGKLKKTERLIVEMHLLEGMTFQEIADALSAPLGTITWKYQNSMKQLRRAV